MTRRRWLGVLVSVALVSITAASSLTWWVVADRVENHALAAEGTVSNAPITIEVRREPLIETLRVRSSAQFETSRLFSPISRPGELPIVTKLYIDIGQEVSDGDILARIGTRPIVIAQGSAPLFRELAMGVQGDDVCDLQRFLRRHVEDTLVADCYFDLETSRALGRWYATHGLAATPAPEAPEDLASAKASVAQAASELRSSDVDSVQRHERAQEIYDALRTGDAYVLPLGELLFVETLPVIVDEVLIGVGELFGGELMSYRSDVFSVAFPAERISPSRDLGEAQITMTVDAADVPVLATETRRSQESGVAEVVLYGQRSDIAPGREIEIVLEWSLSEEPTLVIPLSALFTDDGESLYVVKVVDDQETKVPVSVGERGDNGIEVRGSGLRVGDRLRVDR